MNCAVLARLALVLADTCRLSSMFYNKTIVLLGLEVHVTTYISLGELFTGSSDPYLLDGRLHVPSIVERSMATPE